MRSAALGVLIAVAGSLVMLAGGCGGDGGAGGVSSAGRGRDGECPSMSSAAGCTLRQVGAAVGVRVGAAVRATSLRGDEAYRRVVGREFSAVTPEFEAGWPAIEATRGTLSYRGFDEVVAFAEAHGQSVRGHPLVWDQRQGLPRWVDAIANPATLRAAVDRHVRDVVGRYRGRVARWDVVNEPLERAGPALGSGHLRTVLGAGYIADAFRVAHEADPAAVLYLNESNAESVPAKADGLVALVAQLRRDGVPVGGVGLEMHLLGGRPPQAGVVAGLVGRLRRLGVEVAVTELDVPRAKDGSTAAQLSAYRRVASECREAGCREITTWGVGDDHTWLDRRLGRANTDPLLFDTRLRPKATYRVFRDALAATRR